MKPNISWKDKRIEAINQLSKKKRIRELLQHVQNPYLEEYHAVYKFRSKNFIRV
jgi:hypothetical protein